MKPSDLVENELKEFTTLKPQFLYKYHQMNLHLIEMLTSAELYMSSKFDLNDPLDSACTISLENYLNLYFEKYPSLKNDPKHVEIVINCFKWKLERGDNDWISDIDESKSKLRVSCFTEDGNNSLMWSHYAENHTGVCLKFEPAEDPILDKVLFPVKYTDELIDAKNISDFSKSLLTKLRTWEIEKEWRIISDKTKFPFKQESLVEIVLGLRVPNSTMRWFKQFRENVYFMHAPLYKLKIKGNKLVKVDEWDFEVE
jgi:hypothetical protein